MSIRGKKNFQNGKIYQITSHCGDKIYIGSTTKKYLSQRMDKHRSSYKQWKQGKAGKTSSFEIFDEYGIENCQILLLESCPCNSNDELVSREGYFIKTNDCVNKYIAGRTSKEYYNDNREAKLDKQKKYNEDNKELISDKCKIYYEANKETKLVKVSCPCGLNICKASLYRHQNSIKHLNFLKTQLNNTI